MNFGDAQSLVGSGPASDFLKKLDMGGGFDLSSLAGQLKAWLSGQLFGQENRPIRMRLGSTQSELTSTLMVHSVKVTEAVSVDSPLQIKVLCISTRADIPHQLFLGQPLALDFVTDRGDIRSMCAIVTRAHPGQSDGGAQTWMVEATDALSFMDGGANSRIFLRRTVVDITTTILRDWQRRSNGLAATFDFDVSRLASDAYPVREMTFQTNESDSAFLRRLWRKHGISWVVTDDCTGEGTPKHKLVLCDDSVGLPENRAGTVAYANDGGSFSKDSIKLWSTVGQMVPGKVERKAWDYKTQVMSSHDVPGAALLGNNGADLAGALIHSRVEPPHWADSGDELRLMATRQMQAVEARTGFIEGAGSVRSAQAGTWIEVKDFPGANSLSVEDRQFLFTRVTHWGQNNLPKDISARVNALFASSGWGIDKPRVGANDEDSRYVNTFTAVKRQTQIFPDFDAKQDWPSMHPVSAVVVCPEDEEVHCDAYGRIKVQIQGLRAVDNDDAQGAGTNGDDGDSAWVRVATPAGNSLGGQIQLPRSGDEVLIAFIQGDPDKPLVTHSMHSQVNEPPKFNRRGELPGNRYLSGNVVREIGGNGYAHTRFDATPGEVGYQAAVDDGQSELNLGHIRHPRSSGKATARGVGAELRSDHAATVRGARGVLITAEAQPNAEGAILARQTLVGQMESAKGQADALGKLAEQHGADGTAQESLDMLAARVEQMDWATPGNGEKATEQSRRPIVAINGPAGVAVSSDEGLAINAGEAVDINAASHAQVSTGKSFRVRALEAVSIFAATGIKLIAGAKDVLVQANAGRVQVGASQDVHIYSTGGNTIIESAKSIILKTPGGQIVIDANGVSLAGKSSISGLAPSFDFKSGSGGGVELPALPGGAVSSDECFVLFNQQNGEPVPNRRYTMKLDNGQVISGKTDAQGRTQVAQSQAMSMIELIVHAPA